MKLDPTELRYLSGDEFRTLTAVEMGSKNHEVVPEQLIAQISGLRSGGVNKCIGELAKRNLVAKVPGAKYAGYRLTYGGYDFLAMRTFAKRNTVYSVGNQIGTGKESDIYVVANEEGETFCLKIHRLGRISFRTIKSKRDYLRKGQSASWMYMSRLAAMKEFAFMKVLHEHGFPVPMPIDQARHCLVMELFDAFPLRQISDVADPGGLYSDLMDLIVRLARSGLIHGDFNEFNILIKTITDPETGIETAQPILIDFPQMVSTEHENAEYYFNRDVECIRTFFKKRFRYESPVYPRFLSTIRDGKKDFDLDVMVAASGFGKKEGEALERYMKMIQEAEENEEEDPEGEYSVDESEEGSSDDEEGPEQQPEASTSKASLDGRDDSEGFPEQMRRMDVRENGTEHNEEEDYDEQQDEAGQDHLPDEHGEEQEEHEDDEQMQNRRKASKLAKQPWSNPAANQRDVQGIVAASLEKKAKAQNRKHHGKKGVNALGKAKGSKRKADPRNAIRDSAQF